MRRKRSVFGALALLSAGAAVVTAAPSSSAAGGRQLVANGSVVLRDLPDAAGNEGLAAIEWRRKRPGRFEDPNPPTLNEPGPGVATGSSPLSGAASRQVRASFDGLNHRDSRLADGGNQFSGEPPDQALCVGPSHIVEVVNSAIRVRDKQGGVVANGATKSLNQFYGYPHAIDRTTGEFGPNLFDPVCHYDADTGRFWVVVDTLHQDVDGNLTGRNTLDIAVSMTGDPTAGWFRWQLPVQNDGTEGTPDHQCDAGPTNGPCFGDYPHIGADAYGMYLTTNEYSLLGSDYNGAQIYAVSKRALAAGTSTPTFVHVESPVLGPFRSFTVWPAISPAGKESKARGGTEYFLSSTLGDGSETGNFAPKENRIGVWAFTNTRSLDSATPNLTLQNTLVKVADYTLPPKARQAPGPIPLAECVNDTTIPTPFGVGCWNLLFNDEPAHDEALTQLDAGDSRMQQVVYANGRIYGALGTGVRARGASTTEDGILWMSIKPKFDDSDEREDREGGDRERGAEAKKAKGFGADVKDFGYVAVAGKDLSYPALGVTRSNKVVIGVTVSGPDIYPSAGYVTVGENNRSSVTVVAPGKGPQDGFTGYKSLVGDPPRPRWGDYGAAAMDGDTIWFANEYIGQRCTLQEFLTGAIGSCGGTRTSLANWGTRITGVRV